MIIFWNMASLLQKAWIVDKDRFSFADQSLRKSDCRISARFADMSGFYSWKARPCGILLRSLSWIISKKTTQNFERQTWKAHYASTRSQATERGGRLSSSLNEISVLSACGCNWKRVWNKDRAPWENCVDKAAATRCPRLSVCRKWFVSLYDI